MSIYISARTQTCIIKIISISIYIPMYMNQGFNIFFLFKNYFPSKWFSFTVSIAKARARAKIFSTRREEMYFFFSYKQIFFECFIAVVCSQRCNVNIRMIFAFVDLAKKKLASVYYAIATKKRRDVGGCFEFCLFVQFINDFS